ncbi:MAG TPA: DMT family transporter, partial [Solirubrobacteraceae bacterium]|nr:DMT family transporter [Solirubrobacteraceae bacterium]
MLDVTLGIAAAIGSSIFYSLGIAFQATDAKTAPREQYLRAALLIGLLRRARWLLGTGLTVLGWPLQVLALSLAPLVVVQPALAMGLIVLLLLAERMLGEHAGRYEYLAMTAIVVGVVCVGLCAPPVSHTHTSEQATITIVLVALGLASLIPYGLRLIGHSRAELTMCSAGLAFAWSAIATKLASDDLATGHTLTAGLWALSTLAASIVGLLSEMSALQSRPAIQVAPVVFVTQTVVPVVLAPLLLGERFSETPLGGVPLALSLALLIGGAAMLVRSPLLLALMAGDRSSQPSGSGRSPSD